MAAFEISGSVVKTEFSGEYAMAYADLTTDAATGDYTFTDFDEVEVVGIALNGDPVAGCAYATALEDETTLNKVNVKLWKSDMVTAADANYVEVRVWVKGQYKSN